MVSTTLPSANSDDCRGWDGENFYDYPSSHLARLWTSMESSGDVGTGDKGGTDGVYSEVGMLHLRW